MENNDLISRSDLLEKSRTAGLYDAFVNEYPPKNIVFSEDVIGAPAVDAVPVVRCKDCKHYSSQGACEIFTTGITTPDWQEITIAPKFEHDHFCSYGERKDAECESTKSIQTVL